MYFERELKSTDYSLHLHVEQTLVLNIKKESQNYMKAIFKDGKGSYKWIQIIENDKRSSFLKWGKNCN